jgi:ribonuclease III
VAKLSPSERVRALEERLGVRLEQQELALRALTHKTYVNEHPEEYKEDNQRLEFLGDAVINLAVGHWLMERMPQAPEGELTRLRALVVNAESLANVARRLGLGELLLLGRGEVNSGGRDKSSLLADALEATIGAIYLGSGMQPIMVLVDRYFTEALEWAKEAIRDYKTLLQHQMQEQLKVTPRYRLVSESGPEQTKIFEVEVLISEVPYARATGRSKREAEQGAARLALQRLSEPPPPQEAGEGRRARQPAGQGSEADTTAGNPLAPPKAGE